MGPLNGRNTKEVNYFSLEEYVDRIQLDDNTLYHMEYTNKSFESYLHKLSKYGNYSILYYWLDSLKKELYYSKAIENHVNEQTLFFDDKVFFESLALNHARIKKIHQIVTEDSIMSNYRKTEVRVSTITNGKEDIFWRGVKAVDVKKFMDDFITILKNKGLSTIFSNPFLTSALAHLIFVRIHPFTDGNGRTARMIHNIKFTQALNNLYDSNLRVCPLNLSQSILINKQTYVNIINSIYFDLVHDSNHEINQWFDFMLNMADEQIYYSENRLPSLETAFKNISQVESQDDSYYAQYARKMKIFS